MSGGSLTIIWFTSPSEDNFSDVEAASSPSVEGGTDRDSWAAEICVVPEVVSVSVMPDSTPVDHVSLGPDGSVVSVTV